MNQLKEMIIPKIEVYRIIPIVMFPQYIRKWKLVLKGSSQIFMPPCFINSGQLFSVHISNNNTCSHQAVLFWITFFPVMIYLFQKWKFPVFWKIVAQFRFVIDAIPVGVDKHRKTVRPKRGNHLFCKTWRSYFNTSVNPNCYRILLWYKSNKWKWV